MPKNPAKIREQIAALEADLAQAERDQAEKKRGQIASAADRAGLLKLDIPAKTIEREFREIAQRYRGERAASAAQAMPTGATQTGATDSGEARPGAFNSGTSY